MASIFDFPSRRAWNGLALAALVAYGALAMLDFSIKLRPLAIIATVCVIFASAGHFYLRQRPDARLFVMFMGLCYFTTIGLTAGVLSFALVPFAGPLWDGRFIALERALGIDWPALADFMAGDERVNRIWSFAYSSSFSQILCVLFLLPGFGHGDRLAAYLKLIGAMLALAATIALLFPTVGPIEAYHLTDAARHRLGDPGYGHLEQFSALREGRLTVFDLAHMEGMVTFPSFHTIMAIITAWALWPLRLIGPLAGVLNAILIVSTIPWGGHYLIDIPAGAAIAFAGIALMTRGRAAASPLPATVLAAE